MAVIKLPDSEDVERVFRPYALVLGTMAYHWNGLVEALGDLFAQVLGGQVHADLSLNNQYDIAKACWFSNNNDRSKLKMLQAALAASKRKYAPPHRVSRDDLLWLVSSAQNLNNFRNIYIHAPIEPIDRGSGLKIEAVYFYGNPIAKSLAETEVVKEMELLATSMNRLKWFAFSVLNHFDDARYPWPEKPELPHLVPKETPAETRQGKPRKGRGRPPRSSPP